MVNDSVSTSYVFHQAFQFTVICFSQYLAALLFFVVPKFSGGGVIGVLLMNSIGILSYLLYFSNSCSPCEVDGWFPRLCEW